MREESEGGKGEWSGLNGEKEWSRFCPLRESRLVTDSQWQIN